MPDNPFNIFGGGSRGGAGILGLLGMPSATERHQQQVYSREDQVKADEGGTRARAMARLMELKKANPGAPPQKLMMDFFNTPDGQDIFTNGPADIGKFVTEAITAMETPQPVQESHPPGTVVTQTPYGGKPEEVFRAPTTAEQETTFQLSLSDEEQADWIDLQTSLKAADSTQAERAADRLERAGVPRWVLDRQLLGTLEAVDGPVGLNGQPSGQHIVDKLNGQTIGIVEPNGNMSFGNPTDQPGASAPAPGTVQPGAPVDPLTQRDGAAPTLGDGSALPKAFLNLTAKAEGTDGPDGYNTTLDYGAYTGGPTNLVGMTLDEVDALQTKMLRHPDNPWNSSAVGRYQIVQQTLRGLREKLGLSGNELYDEDMQDTLGTVLLKARGSDPNGLRQEWQGLNKVSDEQIAQALAGQEVDVNFGQGRPGARATPAVQPPAQPGGRGGPSRRNTAIASPPATLPGNKPAWGFSGPAPAPTEGMTGADAAFAAGPVPTIQNLMDKVLGAYDPSLVDQTAVEARTTLASIREAILQWEKSTARGDNSERDSAAVDKRLMAQFDPLAFLNNPIYTLTQMKVKRAQIEEQIAKDEKIYYDQLRQFPKAREDAMARVEKGRLALDRIGSAESLDQGIEQAKKLKSSGKLQTILDELTGAYNSPSDAAAVGAKAPGANAEPGDDLSGMSDADLRKLKKELGGGP